MLPDFSEQDYFNFTTGFSHYYPSRVRTWSSHLSQSMPRIDVSLIWSLLGFNFDQKQWKWNLQILEISSIFCFFNEK